MRENLFPQVASLHLECPVPLPLPAHGQTLVSYVSKSMSDLPVGHLLEKFLSFMKQPALENSDAR
jgi:hypothetical protein